MGSGYILSSNHNTVWRCENCEENMPYLLFLLSISESCFQNGEYYAANDIDKLENIASAHDCQKKCQELPTCQFWTHNNHKNRGYCWRQNGNNIPQFPCEPTFACTHGPRDCKSKGG